MPKTLQFDTREYLHEAIAGEKFQRIHFDSNFNCSTFEDCDFIDCRLDRVTMMKTRWRRCRFDRSIIIAEFTDAIFEDCSFRYSDLRGRMCEYGGVRAIFDRCDFSGASIKSLKLRACKFSSCEIDTLTIQKSDVRGATHNGIPLQNNG
jgi:uncharacterized protein YjbI with pentapeptide repeats